MGRDGRDGDGLGRGWGGFLGHGDGSGVDVVGGRASLNDVDDGGDGGLGHLLEGPVDGGQSHGFGVPVVLVAEAEDGQVGGDGQAEVVGGLEDAGCLRVVGERDEGDAGVLGEESHGGLVGRGCLPVRQGVEGEVGAEGVCDGVLAGVVRVWPRQENGAPRTHPGRWVDERAVGQNLLHSGAFVDADEGGFGPGGVGLDHGHGDDGDTEVGKEAGGEGFGGGGLADDACELCVA